MNVLTYFFELLHKISFLRNSEGPKQWWQFERLKNHILIHTFKQGKRKSVHLERTIKRKFLNKKTSKTINPQLHLINCLINK